MNKLLAAIIFTGLFTSIPVMAETIYTQKQTPYKNYGSISSQQETVFSKTEPSYDTTSVDKTVISQKVITKELKQKYKDITKNDKLIEACELLKNGAGNFSYRSLHGNNKTCAPLKILFINFSKDEKYKNTDAYGIFSGSKYEIRINSKYIDAPAAALAPLIAREALVSKNKTSSDKEAAEQLQIAVWTQMINQNPALKSSQNPLVVLQNKVKAGGNPEEYSAFLNEAKSPQPGNSVPPEKVTRAFGKGAPSQSDFDYGKQAKNQKVQSEILSFDSKELQKKYKKITNEDRIIEALELLKDTVGKFSHDAILGNNLTNKPIAIKFKNLSEIKPQYATFDALGWRQAGKLNIYINHKHADAPAAAIAALLAHEALHQDEFDSLNEETYAWTMEASVWTQLCDKQPMVEEITHPPVTRENLLKKLLEKGNYTNKYIKKSVFSNPSYSQLPVRSPGFEDDL